VRDIPRDAKTLPAVSAPDDLGRIAPLAARVRAEGGSATSPPVTARTSAAKRGQVLAQLRQVDQQTIAAGRSPLNADSGLARPQVKVALDDAQQLRRLAERHLRRR
jgi:hypothetical protein